MKPMPLANSLAAATGVLWVIMSLFIWATPNFSLMFYRSWLMGAAGVPLTGFNLDLTTFLVGGVTMVATIWVFGYLWGWFYKKFS